MSVSGSAVGLSPDEILAFIEDYPGLIVDLDKSLTVPPQGLADARWKLARKIGDSGLKAGDRVIVAAGNGPLFIATWAAILMRGGSPVLVHWQTPAAELKRIAERFHIRFVAADSQSETDLEAIGAAATTFDCGAWARLLWADFGGATEPQDSGYLSLPGVPLHPTSGTTSQPKMAVRPASSAVAEARHYVETIGIDHHDRLLALAPMSHAYGHGWYVITPMVTGADVYTMRRFKPKMVVRACHQYGVTILPVVGAILDTLFFGAAKKFHDPSRRVFTGGAPVSARTSAGFLTIAGTRPRPLYGTTEAGAIAVVDGDERAAVRGCVGLPFSNVEVDIRAPVGESEFENGLGLVHVRSPSVMAGYLVDERLDTSSVADGWFNTGDLGRLDESGALHLRGRQAEVINVSGMKVLPSEVEEVIASLPGVTEVKVYAGKTRAGAHVRAAVVAEEGVDVPRIRAFCEEHLVYYKRPARITLLEALPRSPAGKIVQSLLP